MARQPLSDRHRPTIVDVAGLSGVSRQTVSRVLADHPRVADATRDRVQQAIETLDYRPNHMARALVTKRSLTFGIASVDMRNLHFSETCSGMQASARRRGYHLIVTEFDIEDKGGIGTLDTLLNFGVEGIALFPSAVSDNDVEDFIDRTGCPLVIIGRTTKIPNVVSIGLDEREAARQIVNHLIERGKHNLAIVMNEMYPRVVHERYLALSNAIEAATGVTTPPVTANRPTPEGGRAAVIELLRRHPDIDAVIAFNDTMAMGAMIGCRDLGKAIPQDVGIVGYDGILYGALTAPPLTTVVQDSFGMAGAAFEALLTCLKSGCPPEGHVDLWEPELLVRGTT